MLLSCRDLLFPHHENEIAQSQAAATEEDRKHMVHGKDFVRFWVHNGFVNGARDSRTGPACVQLRSHSMSTTDQGTDIS